MENRQPLASEILREQQRRAKRWRVAFVTVLSLLVIVTAVLCCLLSAR